jgi:hypothetical protein
MLRLSSQSSTLGLNSLTEFVTAVRTRHTNMASSRASENPLSRGRGNTIDERVSVSVRVGDKTRFKLDILGLATFDNLHEECVKHANSTLHHPPFYTIDNTTLELGSLERYRDILQTEEIFLKPVGPEKLVRNYKLFAIFRHLDLYVATQKAPSMRNGADTPIMTSCSDLGTTPLSPHRSHLKSVSLELDLAPKAPTAPTAPTVPTVSVRWITVKRALYHDRLSDIKYDIQLDSTASLLKLKECAGSWLNSNKQSPPKLVECYLTNCYLSVTPEKCVTLAELGLEGSEDEPLNIFVVQLDTSYDQPGAKEALEKLVDEMNKDVGLSNGLSEALLRATHFPPAILALEELHHSGLEKQESFLAEAVLTDCFLKLAFKLMSNLGSNRDPKIHVNSGLEHVISWLLSQNLSNQCIVRTVQLEHITGTGSPNRPEAFKHVEEVTLPSSVNAIPGRDRVRVSAESTADIELHLLAVALYPCYRSPFNFFLNNSKETHALLNGDLVSPTFPEPIDQVRAKDKGANTGEQNFTNAKGKMKEADNNAERVMPYNQPEARPNSCLVISYV